MEGYAMTENDLEASIIAELQDRGRLSPVTEGQATAYDAAVTECGRLASIVAAMEPGTAEHKRASTALRGAARERDSLARHLGLTEQARKADKKKGDAGPTLHSIYEALGDERVLAGTQE